jgi:phthiocerol/phenolphthiocerol synthesis type-I polyketide synthase E
MRDVVGRLSNLDAERRRLLRKLLDGRDRRSNNATTTAGETRPAFDAPHFSAAAPSTPEATKDYYRHIYNSLNDQLNATPYASLIRFCTFGYVPDGSLQLAQVKLPARLLNKNTIKLVLEVIGDCDLTDRDVLDVGSGRGGTVSVVAMYFHARRVTGIDLSASAVSFCQRSYRYPHVQFREGDAEELPFDDASFDVITNVESSHSYPVIERFYHGVFRVLRPGGSFLYTDLFPHDVMVRNTEMLQRIGFTVERDRDITRNVLLSCDETAAAKLGAYDGTNDRMFMGNFLGTPDSQVYSGMRLGTMSYRILKLRKPS